MREQSEYVNGQVRHTVDCRVVLIGCEAVELRNSSRCRSALPSSSMTRAESSNLHTRRPSPYPFRLGSLAWARRDQRVYSPCRISQQAGLVAFSCSSQWTLHLVVLPVVFDQKQVRWVCVLP